LSHIFRLSGREPRVATSATTWPFSGRRGPGIYKGNPTVTNIFYSVEEVDSSKFRPLLRQEVEE
jgi:hypothetical protein